MLKSIKIISGTAFTAKLPIFANKVEFTDGINLLVGKNGVGKSTMLRVLAGYTGINTTSPRLGGGWSAPPRFVFVENYKFPQSFKDNTIANIEAEVEWDGMPVFYNTSGLSDSAAIYSNSLFNDESESADGMTSFIDHVQMIQTHLSDGQLRGYNLSKLMKTLKSPPEPFIQARETDIRSAKAYAEYVASLPRNGKKTLLLDEIDRNFSLDVQVTFWEQLIPKVAKDYQIIISTHSIIPMLMKRETFNLILFEEGFIEFVMEAVHRMQGTKETPK